MSVVSSVSDCPKMAQGCPASVANVRDGVHNYNAVRIDETRYQFAVAEAGLWLGRGDPATQFAPIDEFVDWCAPYFARADVVAGRFQRRHLRTILALWTLAVIAPASVALHALWPGLLASVSPDFFVWIEIAVLFAIVALFLWARRKRFAERWAQSRVLGERLRACFYLAIAGVAELGAVSPQPRLFEDPADSWIRRALQEVWLRRPVWRPEASDVTALRDFLAKHWIAAQVQYHADRSRRYARYLRISLGLAGTLFGIGVAAALIHLAVGEGSWARAATFGALVRSRGRRCRRRLHGSARLRSPQPSLRPDGPAALGASSRDARGRLA